MKNYSLMQQTPVEGKFRCTQQSSLGMMILVLAILVAVMVAVIGITEQQPLMIVGAIAGVFIVVILTIRRQQQRLVTVRLTDEQLTIKGDGYHIQMQAPFRYQTGVQRIRSTSRKPEFHYVRMVLDVYGKPLVFEEQVASGIQPPDLDEILGISSALGIAELSSINFYPGSLWSIIEHFETMSSQADREQIERDIENLYRIGEQQLNTQSYYGAIQTFSEIIRLTPNSPYPYFNRGTAYFYHGNSYDKAIRDLTTVIRLKPKFDKAYQMRGLVKAERGDWAGSRDDLTEAIRLKPNSDELYNLRGSACYRLQDYQSALSDFDQAIQLRNTNPEPYHNRGLVKQHQGDFGGAITDFQQALTLNPSFVAAEDSLAYAKALKKQVELNQ